MRFLMLSLLVGCSSVDPGTVAVCVDANGTYEVVRSGWYTEGPTENCHELPAMEQQAIWAGAEQIAFAGKDATRVSASMALSYQVSGDDGHVETLVKKYGLGLDATIDGRVRTKVQDAMQECARDLTVEQIYSTKKMDVAACAEELVRAEFEPAGLSIVRLSMQDLTLPEAVQTTITAAQEANAKAIQIRNEVAMVQAEGLKSEATAQAKVASARADAEATQVRARAAAEATVTKATAEAQANRLISQSLTPTILEARRIEAELALNSKWNGALPQTMTGNSIPLVTIR